MDKWMDGQSDGPTCRHADAKAIPSLPAGIKRLYPIRQRIGPSIRQRIGPSIRQPIGQSIRQPIHQPIDPSIRQPIGSYIGQLVGLLFQASVVYEPS